MNFGGDISEEDREHIGLLLEQEEYFDSKACYMPLPIIAQAFVSLAHDWYMMEFDEEGNRLLEKAESVCPGYFSTYIKEHVREDALFSFLVENLTSKIASVILDRLDEIRNR